MNEKNNDVQAGNKGNAPEKGFFLPPHLNAEIGDATASIQTLVGVNARLVQLYNVAYSELNMKTNEMVIANAKIEALISENRELNKKLNPGLSE